MSFFFNTGLEALKGMDEKEGNKNSVVLSNANFRKAFSFAIGRAKYVTATEGYKPAFALLNSLYYYDFYNNPGSVYRNTDQAKKAICNLYGVKWGAGIPYATIDDAVNSITGYNLDKAKKIFKTALDELVAAGLYTASDPIEIKIGWAKGALTDADNKQATLMNEFINAAAKEAGFGTITLTPQMRAIDSINPQDEAFGLAVQNGVTSACTGPGSANVVGGTFAAIKLTGKRVDKMLIKEAVAMKCAFGENPK